MAEGGAGRQVARRWYISGRVQGVGFRWFVVRQAEHFGIRGWTRNLADGRVEVLGAGREGSLLDFEEAIARGPTLSRVDDVEKIDVPHDVVQDKAFNIK